MMLKITSCLAVVVAASAACAPSVGVTPLGGTFEPRPDLAEVAVYTTQVPECPYREIAIVTAYKAELRPDKGLNDVLAALKKRARTLGGDALVGVHLVHSGGESSRAGYSGTAVRFTEDTCRH